MSGVEIITAVPERSAEVEEIERQCFSLPWTRGQIEAHIADADSIFLFALGENGDILGYAGCKCVLDEGYISNIAVHPDCRRRGIAAELVCELTKRARAKKLAFLTLEVRESNAAAIALYEKFGFRAVGKRPGYYEKPKEAAILMTLYFGEKTC